MLTYEKLEKACTLIRNGARFYSTHPDFNCPTETGFIPDSGRHLRADHRLDGRAAPLFRQAAQGNGGDDHAPLRRAVRADGGRRRPALHRHRARPQQRLTSILVLTGETKREDVNDANAPDFIFENIGEIAAFF